MKLQQRTLTATAALFAAATLTLTGCSSGGEKGDGKIAGAEEKSGEPSPSPSSQSGSVARPKIKLRADLSYNFD
ncbi:hypothetical protein [Streptomyces sp. 8N616]|uniref:hypothetical protein n=1 Tax=Streptomyces sp. 8N616 TaxID=3457414 RepID=UPI003FD5F70C